MKYLTYIYFCCIIYTYWYYLFYVITMGERYHGYESKENNFSNIDQKLYELAWWQEIVSSYPKTPEQVRQDLQAIATKLQADINANQSSNEKNNDRRWSFVVKWDASSWPYSYLMESYGINTKFKFVPMWWNGWEGRLVLYYGAANTEYMDVTINDFTDVRTIKKFLWRVNSANKEIALCKDYQFLEDLPRLLDKEENRKFYNWYKERYDSIMSTIAFKDLAFESNTWWSRDIVDTMTWTKSRFMDARRSAIKEKKKKQLDGLFDTKLRTVE